MVIEVKKSDVRYVRLTWDEGTLSHTKIISNFAFSIRCYSIVGSFFAINSKNVRGNWNLIHIRMKMNNTKQHYQTQYLH